MSKPVKKRKKIAYEKKKAYAGYIFILPWLLGFFGLFGRTLVSAFRYSVSALTIASGHLDMKYIGFENYVNAFTVDKEFLPLLTAQLQGMAANVPVILAFSLFIAVLLNQKFKGRLAARSIFFLPVIIGSGVVISVIQGDAMSNDIISGARASGLFETSSFTDILLSSGLDQKMIASIMQIVSGIFELTWRSGLQILLFIAALQTVPTQLYEVAKVEGATHFEVFFKVTLPMIMPIATVNIIYTVIDSFTDYGNALLQYILDFGKRLEFAYSSALGYIYFAVIFAIVGIIALIVGRRVVRQ